MSDERWFLETRRSPDVGYLSLQRYQLVMSVVVNRRAQKSHKHTSGHKPAHLRRMHQLMAQFKRGRHTKACRSSSDTS